MSFLLFFSFRLGFWWGKHRWELLLSELFSVVISSGVEIFLLVFLWKHFGLNSLWLLGLLEKLKVIWKVFQDFIGFAYWIWEGCLLYYFWIFLENFHSLFFVQSDFPKSNFIYQWPFQFSLFVCFVIVTWISKFIFRKFELWKFSVDNWKLDFFCSVDKVSNLESTDPENNLNLDPFKAHDKFNVK